jgi:mannose-6-phosphate isomerase-like protein (cupin superfamily)
VVSPALAAKTTRGSLTYRSLVTAELGALYQTQIHLEVAGATSPVIAFGDRDVILFVVSGSGTVNISGRKFNLKATDGAYLRPGEAMQLKRRGGPDASGICAGLSARGTRVARAPAAELRCAVSAARGVG